MMMDGRFSFEKRVIQLVVIGGVSLLSLVYIFSVEWLPNLRRKLQLQSEKYHHLKTLREKQEQQKQQEENDIGDEAKDEGGRIHNPEEVTSTNLSNKRKKLLLRNLENSQTAPKQNANSTTSENTLNNNLNKETSDTKQENYVKKERLARVPLKKTTRNATRHQPQSENTHSVSSPIPPLLEGNDLRIAQDEEYRLSLLAEAAKREEEEKAAVEAAELNMILEESITIRRNELRESLKEIEEETAQSASVVAITFRFKDEKVLQSANANTTANSNPNPSWKNGRLTHRFSTTLPVQKLLDFIQVRELQPLSASFELNLSYPTRTISTKGEPAKNNLTLAEMEIVCDSVIWVTFPDVT